MLAAALVLIALGLVLGLVVFPIGFAAAVAGLVLLIVFFVGGTRRAQTGKVGSDDDVAPPA